MDGLRWILLAAGVLVIVGILVWGRRASNAPEPTERRAPDAGTAEGESADFAVAPDDNRREPVMGGGNFADTADAGRGLPPISGEQVDIEDLVSPGGEPGPEASPAADDDQDPGPPADIPQKIITVRIVGVEKATFPGDKLVLSLRGIGMRHGRFGIFHRYDGNDENRVVFSAASLVEPGSFDLENLKDQRLPGISLFMVLPGPVEGAEAFDLMMAAARTLTQSLSGELLDESGSSLSIQRERYLREEIIQYQLAATRA